MSSARLLAVIACGLLVTDAYSAEPPSGIDAITDPSWRALALLTIPEDKPAQQTLKLSPSEVTDLVQLQADFTRDQFKIAHEWSELPEGQRTQGGFQQQFNALCEQYAPRFDKLFSAEQAHRWKQILFQKLVRDSFFEHLLVPELTKVIALEGDDLARFERTLRAESLNYRQKLSAIYQWPTVQSEKVLTAAQWDKFNELVGEWYEDPVNSLPQIDNQKNPNRFSPLLDFVRYGYLREELEILDYQSEQIGKLIKDYKRDLMALKSARTQQLQEQKKTTELGTLPQPLVDELRRKKDEELVKVLLPHQLERLRQLIAQAQIRGEAKPRMLTTIVIKALEIDQQQQQQLSQIMEEGRQRIAKESGPLYTRSLQAILAELTVDQRATYYRLVGPAYEFAGLYYR